MPEMDPPLSFERGMERFTRFRVPDKKPDLLFELFIPDRTLCPQFPAGSGKIGMNDDPEAHASISLKKSSMESYVFPFPFLISASAFFTCLINSGLIADSGG